MFEDEKNSELKCLMKGADYISALSEICRQMEAGTKDKSFFKAVELHRDKLFYSDNVEITPDIAKFVERLASFANSLNPY